MLLQTFLKILLLVSILMQNNIALSEVSKKDPESKFETLKTALPNFCQSRISLNITGDLAIHNQNKQGALKLFKNIKTLFKNSDINIVNLEGAITEKKEKAFESQKFSLLIDDFVPEVLSKFNIHHVTRANNHSMDFGEEGRLLTDKKLSENNIKWTGIGANKNLAMTPIEIVRGGIKIHIFAFTTTYPIEAWANKSRSGVAAPSLGEMKKAIFKSSQSADFTLVVYHWGDELKAEPKSHQIRYSHEAIDAGASLVLGHHAHIAQKIERYHKRDIAYGLGNFIFTPGSVKPSLGLIANIQLCQSKDGQRKVIKTQFIPIDIHIPRTKNMTKPYTQKNFLKEAKYYLTNNLFSQDTLFYFPKENQTIKVSDLSL